MTSLQALSGAGYPGHSAMDIVDNVVPFINKEEGKVVIETVKNIRELRRWSGSDCAIPA